MQVSQQTLTNPEEIIESKLEIAQLHIANNNFNLAFVDANEAYLLASQTKLQALQVDALLKLGEIERLKENFDLAVEYLRRGLILSKDENDTKRSAAIHFEIGRNYSLMYSFDKANDEFRKSLMLATSIEYKPLMSQTYAELGNLFRSNLGKASEAIGYYERGYDLFNELGDSTQAAWMLNRLGNCNIDLGNYMKAYNLYEQSRDLHKKFGNTIGIVAGYNNIGEIFRYQGNFSEALENYIEGLKYAQNTNDQRSMAILFNNIGIIYYEQSIYNVAIEYFKKSIELSEPIRYHEGMVETFTYMGLTNKKRKNYELAMSYFSNSLNLSQEIGDRLGEAFALNAVAETYYQKGENDSAYKYYTNALELEKKIQDRTGVVRSMIGMARIKLSINETLVAVKILTDVMNMAKEIGLNLQVAESYQLLSEAYEKQNRFAISLDFFKRYNALNDSLQNSKVTQQIEVMQQKFEGEQREKEVQLLRKEKELQAVQIERSEVRQTITVIGLILILIAAVLGWYGFNERRKAFETLDIQKREIENKNKDITDSIQYARRIQSALLTSNDYLDKVMADHFIFYKPKDIVSGDFYWAYLNSQNQAIIAVVDCTGHGVPGAFMSMIGMGLLNEIVMEHKLRHSHEILNALREGVIQALKQDGEDNTTDGMDISLTVWNKDTNRLEFSGANNPLYIVRNGELHEIKGDKQPIGWFIGKKKPFSVKNFQLEKGDMVYLFSDGFADQFGERTNKKYKYVKFKKLLTDISTLPAAEQKQSLENEFLDWKGRLNQLDDICILGYRV